jgi:hypothetical protein
MYIISESYQQFISTATIYHEMYEASQCIYEHSQYLDKFCGSDYTMADPTSFSPAITTNKEKAIDEQKETAILTLILPHLTEQAGV